jgi:hypothetical protein
MLMRATFVLFVFVATMPAAAHVLAALPCSAPELTCTCLVYGLDCPPVCRILPWTGGCTPPIY